MTIDKALIIQFSDALHVQAQQIKSRTRQAVTIKQMSGDVFAYDGLGAVEAQEVVGRVQKTTFTDIEHLRRKISRRRFAVTLPIDDMDERAVLLNPQSEYSQACIRAMERVFDRVVVQAMFATVYTGKDFETSVSFATDGGVTVDATSGLTFEKILEIKKNFLDAEVGTETPEEFFLGVSGDEHEDLLAETEFTSRDYTANYVLDKGEVETIAGFKVIKFAGGSSISNPILPVASSVRDCFAISKRAVCVGMSKEMQVTIKDRSDYIDVKQVQIVGIFGAVRTEGVQVQKVQATE